MTVAEIRKRYLDFFASRGHKIIPAASLVPENDPSTLFTGSGMQPLVPYLLGAPHPEGKRVADSQKCFRAEDIDDVGDNRHTTFFEMLGNWSFGDYFKKEQLPWVIEFLTKEAGIPKERLWVTCFEGDEKLGLPRDTESAEIWKGLGIPEERIRFYGSRKNWWSRSGPPENMPAGEPGGPDSEVFYEFNSVKHDPKFGKECHPNCDCGRFMEIGNSVFMEYKKNEGGSFEKLKQRNVDFGGGLERITAAANNDPDMFKIDIFMPLWDSFADEIGLGRKYSEMEDGDELKKAFRVAADHIRAAVFLMADGIDPSNKGRGYILRRLLRRVVFYMHYGQSSSVFLKKNWLEIAIRAIAASYTDAYPEVAEHLSKIVELASKESEKFDSAIEEGLREFNRLAKANALNGNNAFDLYQNFGFPWELTWELAKTRGLKPDKAEFQKQFEIHREKSRTASAGAFKGGLADHSEKVTRLHTAHHLLLKALQIVLGPQVKQRGSNITSERLRMDFSYDGKMTDEQKKEAERIVNEKISEDLPTIHSEVPREEAEKLGAEHEFGQKYPDRVSVYSVGPKSATVEVPQFEKAFSIEFCGGPHVKSTGEIGKFKIIKEEASSAGVRRIRATVK